MPPGRHPPHSCTLERLTGEPQEQRVRELRVETRCHRRFQPVVREEMPARGELETGETGMFDAFEAVSVRHGNRLVCGTAGDTQPNVWIAGGLCREGREPGPPVGARPGLVQTVDTKEKR